MFELLFLLLPIAAGYGWYMGNRSAQNQRQEQSHKISRGYVEGLNLLLSDQSDKAVDVFIDLLQVDSETIDTHLALGNLFRSRGEVDRAIRIHQNLIARTNLTIDQRNLALQQLGTDYMMAGFFDRSEKIFEQLLDEPDYREHALRQLLDIFQRTREWDRAIEAAQQLVKLGKPKLRRDIGQFYCELAMQAVAMDEPTKARGLLKKALAADKQCVRANLISARLMLEEQNFKNVIPILEEVITQDIEFLSEAIPLLSQAYLGLGDEDGMMRFLRTAVEEKAGATAELKLAEFIASDQGAEAAQMFLTRQLVKNPTMRGFYRLMDYHLAEAEEGRAKTSLSSLRALVGEQLKIKPRYRCRKCGFASQSLYWQCPSCKRWASIKPIRGLDGE